MKKTVSILLVLALLLTAIPLSALAMPNPFGDAWVKTANGKTVNARRTPTTSEDNIIKQVPYGAKVVILGYEKDMQWAWCNIGNGTEAYIMTRYLVRQNPGKYKPTDPEKGTGKDADYSSFKYLDEPYTATVKPATPSGSISLRWAPSKNVKTIEKYYQGAELTVIAVGKDWCQVRDEETGYTGFMMSKFLKY